MFGSGAPVLYNTHMITTLTGANDFARTAALEARVAACMQEHGEFAVERLDGEEASAERMRAAAESMPFLSEHKLVVLREPSAQKEFAESIDAFLDAVPETTDVIIYEPKLDKRLNYYKTLKKRTDFQEFGELDTAGLSRWAVAYASEHAGVLSLADARMLIDRLGASQQLLRSELDKLLAYEPHITRQTIEILTERTPQSTVFELLDAAFAGNAQRALTLYKEQRSLKVEPQAIIALLAWQLHILALVCAGAPRSADEIARTAKLSPFVVRKSQRLAEKLSLARIKSQVAQLLELDERLKTQAMNADEAVQLYLLRLAS